MGISAAGPLSNSVSPHPAIRRGRLGASNNTWFRGCERLLSEQSNRLHLLQRALAYGLAGNTRRGCRGRNPIRRQPPAVRARSTLHPLESAEHFRRVAGWSGLRLHPESTRHLVGNQLACCRITDQVKNCAPPPPSRERRRIDPPTRRRPHHRGVPQVPVTAELGSGGRTRKGESGVPGAKGDLSPGMAFARASRCLPHSRSGRLYAIDR